MKIISLKASNFKRLTAVDITPHDNMVQITGRNGQGKTSVLDAIFAALGGKDAVPSRAIRNGAESARIELNLGDYIVTRRIRASGTDLVVEAPSGKIFKSPQAVMDSILGRISCDPLSFMREKPTKQFETVKSICQSDFDFDAFDGLNQKDFDKRTEVKKEAARLFAEASSIIIPIGTVLPETAFNVDQMTTDLARAGEHNALMEKRKRLGPSR